MTDDPHAHCKRPIWNVYVQTSAEAVLTATLDATVEQLLGLAEQAKLQNRNEAGSADAAYENAARLVDANFRAALMQHGEVHEGEPE